MGIFKRKSAPKDITKEDTGKFEKDYKNVYEALKGEFGIGSLDTKEAVFYFDDVNYLVRCSEGKVKIVFNIPELNLESRLAYEPESEKFKDVPGSVNAFDIMDGYSEIMRTSEPEVLKGIFKAYSIRRAQELLEKFPKLIKVRSEILSQQSAVVGTKSADFLNYSIDELKEELDRLEKLRKEFESDLGISSSDFSSVKIKVLNKNYVSRIATENYILDIASGEGTNLQTIKDTSDGFIFEDLLETILMLSVSDIVEVDYPGRLNENWSTGGDSLPSLDDDDFISIGKKEDSDSNFSDFGIKELRDDSHSKEILDSEVLTGDILEPVDGYSYEENQEAESFSSIDDDGKFFYEEMAEVETSKNTLYASDNIEPDILRISNNDLIDESKKSELHRKVRQNFVLEQELEDIESLLEMKRQKYEQSLGDFENLKFNAEIDHVGHDEAVTADTETLTKIEKTKDSTSVNFLEVESVESDRYLVNSERLSLLERIAVIVAELSDEEVQSILHRIDLKIKGINSVENIAFHSPMDAQLESVDPDFLEVPEVMTENDSFVIPNVIVETEDKKSIGDSILPVVESSFANTTSNLEAIQEEIARKSVRPTKKLTPAYFAIVEKYGFNPLV